MPTEKTSLMIKMKNIKPCALKMDSPLPRELLNALIDGTENWLVDGRSIFLKDYRGVMLDEAYAELKWIIDEILRPNGITLNGKITVDGMISHSDDVDLVVVENEIYEQPMLPMF